MSFMRDSVTKLIELIRSELINKANKDHLHTKDQVGLDQVDNVSDKNKPVSDATRSAIDQSFNTAKGLIDGITPESIGALSKSVVRKNANLNEFLTEGSWYIEDTDSTSASHNLPGGAVSGWLDVKCRNQTADNYNAITQVFYRMDLNYHAFRSTMYAIQTYRRSAFKNNDGSYVWTPWVEIVNTGTQLGRAIVNENRAFAKPSVATGVWIRFAKLTNDSGVAWADAKGASGLLSTIQIEFNYNKYPNESYQIMFLSKWSQASRLYQTIGICSSTQHMSKIRYVSSETDKCGYLDFYWVAPETNMVQISIVNAEAHGTYWNLMPNPVLETPETKEGEIVEVTLNMYSYFMPSYQLHDMYDNRRISMGYGYPALTNDFTWLAAWYDTGGDAGVQLRAVSPASLGTEGFFTQIKAKSMASSWIDGATLTRAAFCVWNPITEGSFHPILTCKTAGGHSIGLGGINNQFGFYGWLKDHIEAGTPNDTDMSFYFDFDNKMWMSDKAIHSDTHLQTNGSVYGKSFAGVNTTSFKNSVLGINATAFGNDTTASADNSHAEGTNTKATGVASHAEGSLSYATGLYSHAEGSGTTASGAYSHAEGKSTSALKIGSHAEGYTTYANADYSHAEGFNTQTTAAYSHAQGLYANATNQSSHASGHYPVSMVTGGNEANTTGTAFNIGNGTASGKRRNAFSVMFDGVVKAASTITASTTADYAEYFEWEDGNLLFEDRVGLFVTMNGEMIKIAEPESDYILGIVSGEPFVLGNGDCDVWNGMVLRDDFGRIMYERAPMVKINEETGEPEVQYDEDGNIKYMGTRPIENPDYNPDEPYVPRQDRPEWAAIGMLGVLSVRQDGTVVGPNCYCTCGEGGVATLCERSHQNAYRVIKVISESVVKVVFK